MKRNFYSALLPATAMLLSTSVLSQTGPGQVKISLEWYRIETHGSNQLAIWIEDTSGTYVTTVFATKFTANGGYERRPVSLGEWAVKSDVARTAKDEVDAFTGNTPPAGPQTWVWNCTDRTGKPVIGGIYVVRMEANIKNDKKMYYRGTIETGDQPREGSGNITFSDPALESGDVLFRNVKVSYVPSAGQPN